MRGQTFALVACVLGLSACVQILGGDFEIMDGPDAGGAGSASGGSGAMGTAGAGPGGAGAGGASTPTLTVTLDGSGTGRVVSTPAGIDCPTTCVADFEPGSSVTLTGEADADSAFVGWSDDCSGEASCELSMDEAKAVGSSFALHGSRRWVTHVSHPGDDYVLDMVLDPSGNIVVVGTVEVTAGMADIYVAKLAAADGSTVWEKILTTTTGEAGGAVTVDSEGNVYAGFYVSSLGGSDTIEGFPVQGDLFGNVLVMRLAAGDGAVDWLHEWGGGGQDRPHALGVSGDNLYVAGETSSSNGMFGSFPLNGSTGDAFLVRASRLNGTVLDARTFGGNNDVHDLAVSGADVVVVGEYRAATTINTGVTLPTSDGMADGMVVAFDASTLAARWARTFGDTDNDRAFGAAAYPGGGVVVTGSFQGSVLFATSGTSLTSNGGSRDAFAVRYDAAGAHLWSFRYGGPGDDAGRAIAVTPTGEAILVGDFAETITFGTHTLTGTGTAADVFVTRMSGAASPIHEWAVKLGGDGYDSCESTAVNALGDVFVLGQFSGMTDIDGEPLTSTMYDSWVAGLVR